jgi:hypothetical protein
VWEDRCRNTSNEESTSVLAVKGVFGAEKGGLLHRPRARLGNLVKLVKFSNADSLGHAQIPGAEAVSDCFRSSGK